MLLVVLSKMLKKTHSVVFNSDFCLNRGRRIPLMPRNQISDDFYNSVKININNNFNSSLADIMASEIIQNSSYEIYDQNIDKLFMY